jgi:catecholate siderophore receptor
MTALTKALTRTAVSFWLVSASILADGGWACAAAPLADEAGQPTPVDQLVVVSAAPRKIDVPLLTEPIVETPQTITLITSQMIELSGLSDQRDVLRFDPSVSPHADEDSGLGTNVQIRGFSARNDLYRDGQLDLGRYYRDPFDLETVEVLTGPSSVLFGRGSTGGAVNDVSKSPSVDAHAAGALTLGSDNLARLTADMDTPLSASSALRVNGVLETSGTAGRDQVNTQRAGISPVIAFGLGGPTEIRLGLLSQSEHGRPDYGVPWIDIASPTGISHPASGVWKNYYGFKDDYARDDANTATAGIKQQLGANWKFNDQLRYAWFTRSFRATEPSVDPLIAQGAPLSSVMVTRTVRGVSSSESLLDDQASLSGRFKLGSVTHKLVIGAEIGRQTSDPTTFKYSGVPGTSLLDPAETTLFSGTVATKSAVRFSADTVGAYVGDTLEFGRVFEVEGVARFDRFAAHYTNTVPSLIILDHTDEEPSFRAAVVYKPAPAGRIYIMGGTSFDPSAEGLSLSASTADLVPERTHTVEAGIKWNLAPALLVSAAAFRTIQTNYRETSPLDPTVTTIGGTAGSQGVELLAQGRATARWLVLAGYSYLDAKIISSPNADVGRPLQNAPRNSLRLFSAYDFSHELTVGGAVNYASSRAPSSFADAHGYLQRVPGYATVSAFVRHDLKPGVSLQLNIQNLLDSRYYDGLDDNHVNVGAGRSVHLTLSVKR